MKFSNEIDLLKFLIKNMNNNHRCNAKNLNLFKYADRQTICNYLDILKKNGYISVYIGGEFEIHDKGITYIKNNSLTKKVVPTIFKWIAGIITTLITAYLIFKLGLN